MTAFDFVQSTSAGVTGYVRIHLALEGQLQPICGQRLRGEMERLPPEDVGLDVLRCPACLKSKDARWRKHVKAHRLDPMTTGWTQGLYEEMHPDDDLGLLDPG